MKEIEIISRAIVISGGKILVCRDKFNENYFLPGGHVEFGEFSSTALLRELKEELSLDVEKMKFIGTVENMYKAREESQQEINFIYLVKCKSRDFKSNEDHIEFSLFTYREFQEKDVRPKKLKKILAKWRRDKKLFHITTKD